MDPRFIAAMRTQRGGGASLTPTITSVTPNSVSVATGVYSGIAIVGTNLADVSAIDVLDSTHGNTPDGFSSYTPIDATNASFDYDASAAVPQVTVVRVTTPSGTATKAFTITA